MRASRLYVLSRGPILSVVRRIASVAALVVLDVVGLAFGIYLALVVRQVVAGDGEVLWGLLWREGPSDWLKFAAPITVLVFAQAGLYRQRELRPGAGRILACLIVVALIVLAFGIGTGYDSRPRPHPDVVLVSGDDRPAPSGVRVRVPRGHARRGNSAPRRARRGGERASCACGRSLPSARSGTLGYEFVDVVAPEAVGLPLSARARSSHSSWIRSSPTR